MHYLAKCAIVYQPDGAQAPIEAAPGSIITDLPEDIAPRLLDRGSIQELESEPEIEPVEPPKPKGRAAKEPKPEPEPKPALKAEPEQTAGDGDDLI